MDEKLLKESQKLHDKFQKLIMFETLELTHYATIQRIPGGYLHSIIIDEGKTSGLMSDVFVPFDFDNNNTL